MLQNESKFAQGLQRSWHGSQGRFDWIQFRGWTPKHVSAPIWFVPCTSLSAISVGQPKQLQKTTQYTRLLETSKSIFIHLSIPGNDIWTTRPLVGFMKSLHPSLSFCPETACRLYVPSTCANDTNASGWISGFACASFKTICSQRKYFSNLRHTDVPVSSSADGPMTLQGQSPGKKNCEGQAEQKLVW